MSSRHAVVKLSEEDCEDFVKRLQITRWDYLTTANTDSASLTYVEHLYRFVDA